MKRVLLLITSALLLAAAHSQAAETPDTTKIWIPSGKPETQKEERNKKIVLAWLHEFWQGGKFETWPKYMQPDFVNHDPREPLHGAQALVDWLKARMAQSKQPMHFPRPDMDHLFLIADGDLVVIVGSPTLNKSHYADLGAPVDDLAGNIIRMKDGKIAEWWYIGGTVNAAPAGRPAEGGAR